MFLRFDSMYADATNFVTSDMIYLEPQIKSKPKSDLWLTATKVSLAELSTHESVMLRSLLFKIFTPFLMNFCRMLKTFKM